MRKALAVLVLLLVIGLPAAAVGLLAFALEDTPSLLRETALGEAEIARAKRVLQANDPRRAPDGALRTLVLSGRDLDLALDYLLAQHASGRGKVVLQPGSATIWASAALPENPFGRYLNVELVLRETAALPAVESLRTGRVPVPGFLADLLVRAMASRLEAREDGRAARDALRKVAFAQGTLRVVYEWRSDLPERLRGLLISEADRARLRVYHDRLAAAAPAGVPGSPIPLGELMAPVFAELAGRAGGAEGAAEARAALLVLAFYVNGKGLTALLPEARDWPEVAGRTVTLGGREDFAAHFAISAALAAAGGGALADAVGVYKEVQDARGGSGFSFSDIAADRAGTVFGERLTGPRGAALARRVAAGIADSDIMPAAADLPEFMPQAEFLRRFGADDDPRYRAMMARIETRLAQLPLYR